MLVMANSFDNSAEKLKMLGPKQRIFFDRLLLSQFCFHQILGISLSFRESNFFLHNLKFLWSRVVRQMLSNVSAYYIHLEGSSSVEVLC